jgi:hypothetical protein
LIPVIESQNNTTNARKNHKAIIIFYYNQRQVVWNTDMLDGMPRKLLDVSRMNALGWKYKVELPGRVGFGLSVV